MRPGRLNLTQTIPPNSTDNRDVHKIYTISLPAFVFLIHDTESLISKILASTLINFDVTHLTEFIYFIYLSIYFRLQVPYKHIPNYAMKHNNVKT